MAQTLTIRTAGPFTVATNGVTFLVNGVPAGAGHGAAPGARNRAGELVRWLVPTGTVGANGKPDVVGLTEAEASIHWDGLAKQRAADDAAWWASDAGRAAKTSRRAEREYDLANNEGGEGYNPHRHGSAHTYR